jgi:ribose transport system ATP-binding protein
MEDVRKAFGGTIALKGVSFEVAEGEIHALIGENGAGKSTLMRILGGELKADGGSMRFEGAPWTPSGPNDARRAGVAMIHQELALAPHLTVAENIALGCEPGSGVPGLGRCRPLPRRKMRERATAALTRLGHGEIDPDQKTMALGPAQRQIVEIARALASNARVIVMDEPTTSLGQDDSKRLLEVVARLKDDGASIVYISHFLEEVRAVADRWTVLRDGQSVGTGEMEGTSTAALIERMTGRALEEVYPQRTRSLGAVRLRVESVAGARRPREASLTVRRGEIVGLSGLVGAGRTEFLRVLAGLDPMVAGAVHVDENEVPLGATGGVRARMKRGFGLLSEDRKGEGLALRMPIATNLLLSRLGSAAPFGVLNKRAMQRQSEQWISRLAVKAGDVWQDVGTLSGGNQQKIALARLLHQEATILLLDEPTRGIDVGSKVQIYRLLDELAGQGCSIIISSGYAPELIGLCDSIAVMHRGVLGPLHPAAECTEATLMREAVLGFRSKDTAA